MEPVAPQRIRSNFDAFERHPDVYRRGAAILGLEVNEFMRCDGGTGLWLLQC
jgi:hypothetical protein